MARSAVLVLAVVALLATVAIASDDIVIAPTLATGIDVGFILLQGASITTEQYRSISVSIQSDVAAKHNIRLWVGIPAFPLDAVEPLVIASGLARSASALYSAGLPQGSPFFLSGHSLGGAMLQTYAKNGSLAQFPGKVAGVVLLGSFIQRGNLGQVLVPTMTIGGELDGLTRVTRIAEAYYHHAIQEQDSVHYPVVIIPGMNHMQFASGTPPALVASRDLQPEVTEEQAHTAVANAAGLFMASMLGDSASQQAVAALVAFTAEFSTPIITALDQEAFYHFVPPCYSELPCNSSCRCGCSWSQQAQVMMAGLQDHPNVKIVSQDKLHPVDQINPIHLPHVWNNCTLGQPCSLNVTTVTEAVYNIIDGLDTAFEPISANELRVKMVSREWAQTASGMTVDFNVTDNGALSICAQINEQAWEYALSLATPAQIARFKARGIPYSMKPDNGPYNVGPLWIWNALDYTAGTDASGAPVEFITSKYMATPLNYWLSASAGFHYCKLLGPGRALEQILVDGLRK